MFQGNADLFRGQVTLNHGASIAATTTTETTVAFPGAVIGDRVLVQPVASPATGVVVSQSPSVTTTDIVSVRLGNLSTATVAAGTAVVYNVTLIKPRGVA